MNNDENNENDNKTKINKTNNIKTFNKTNRPLHVLPGTRRNASLVTPRRPLPASLAGLLAPPYTSFFNVFPGDVNEEEITRYPF